MDHTEELIVRQAQAMGPELFEIGLYRPRPPNVDHWVEMLRTWDLKTIVESIPWLKFQNVEGRNIYIRPKGEHALSLVDDLTSEALERMKHSGFSPAVIVETSPENFQAWLNHGRVLSEETSTPVARALAEKFGGDPGSADWRHDFRKDLRYQGDGNRIDLAYALYAISNGVPEDEIRSAIASRDLNKKGNATRQADYIERTIQKAVQSVRGEECSR